MPLANKIWAMAQLPGNAAGFTVDIHRMQSVAETGYCVAFSATQNQHGMPGLLFCLAHAQGPNGHGFIGGWHHGGQYYFDSIRLYATRVAAVEAARINSQIGIYDLGRRQYVPIMNGQSFVPSLTATRKRSHSIS